MEVALVNEKRGRPKGAKQRRDEAEPPALPRVVYTVMEFQKLSGLGRGQVYEAMKRGEIPSITIGRRKLIPKRLADRLLGIEEAA